MLTAVVGALFCFRERHLKRLLAFSTISHAGMFLAGFALLTPLGLAGTALYVAGHAFVKAALFLCVGIVLHRLRSVNETWLHGRGRRLPVTGVIFTAAALALADLPPFGTFLPQGLDRGQRGRAVADRRLPGLRHPRRRRGAAGRGRRVQPGRRPAGGGPGMAAEANEETGRRTKRGSGHRCRCSPRRPRWRRSGWPPASPP